MNHCSEDLEEIETVTLNHYNQNAASFWQGTKDHDVDQNYAAFLAPFPKGNNYYYRPPGKPIWQQPWLAIVSQKA